jgi:hypothetical protein
MVTSSVVGCSRFSAKPPDVSDSVRKSLNQAGLQDVSVSQDRGNQAQIFSQTGALI